MDDTADANIVELAPRAEQLTQRLVEEFGDVFASTYPQVVRTVWFIVHDQGIAEQVAQDAFTELFRRWSRLRRYDRPDLWVRRVAIRRAQREVSRAVRRQTLERSLPVPTAQELELPDPALVAAIRELPPKQRAIVVLFYLEDRPMNDVATLVGCSPSTGFVQLHQARKRLAAALGEEVNSDVDR